MYTKTSCLYAYVATVIMLMVCVIGNEIGTCGHLKILYFAMFIIAGGPTNFLDGSDMKLNLVRFGFG